MEQPEKMNFDEFEPLTNEELFKFWHENKWGKRDKNFLGKIKQNKTRNVREGHLDHLDLAKNEKKSDKIANAMGVGSFAK